MLKKTITYKDFNGKERTDDFYFNLTQAEATELELSVSGGLTEMIKRMVAKENGKQIIETIKEFILKAYGEKSADGRRFVKSQELRDSFAQTQAYSNLFMELALDAEAASAFFNGIIPAKEDIPVSVPPAAPALPPA